MPQHIWTLRRSAPPRGRWRRKWRGHGARRLVQPRCGRARLNILRMPSGFIWFPPVADEGSHSACNRRAAPAAPSRIAGQGLGAPAAQGARCAPGALPTHLHLALGEVHPGKERPGGLGNAGAAEVPGAPHRDLRRRLLAGAPSLRSGRGRRPADLHVAVGHDLQGAAGQPWGPTARWRDRPGAGRSRTPSGRRAQETTCRLMVVRA